MVVGMSLYSQIREAYISGESQRSIAKRLGVSRPTVKKYCEGAIMPGVRKEYLRTPSVVTPQVENFIRMCLETDKEEGLRKQSHTAKRIYDRLVSEMGFTGSYSIVRRVVHEMKEQYIPAQADMPLEYDPGDAIQIDWGEATIYLRGERKTIQIFVSVKPPRGLNCGSGHETISQNLKYLSCSPREVFDTLGDGQKWSKVCK